MAGYQVEQITEAGRTIPPHHPPHQQQPEHRTVPPIKLRRVTDDQLRVVTPPTEQSSPEVMEADPAMALRSDSRPVAGVRPKPQPSSINQANVKIDNAQMEPGISEMASSPRQSEMASSPRQSEMASSPRQSEMASSPRQDPVIQPATVSYRETMQHFDPEHYDQLTR